MKIGTWILAILAAGVFTFAGCGKPDQSGTATGEVQAIDATQFRPAFDTAAPEIKATVDNVMMSVQASLYKEALAGLDKLAKAPSLTDPQKKAVADLTDQVKKKMAALAPAASQ